MQGDSSRRRWLDMLSRAGCLFFAFILIYSIVVQTVPARFAHYAALHFAMKCAAVSCFVLLMLLPSAVFRGITEIVNHISISHCFIAALLIRIAWILFGGMEQFSDFADYDRMAIEIAQGGPVIYPDRQAGAAILYAVHYLVLGHNPLYPQITLAVLSALQVFLVGKLVLSTTGLRKAATLSAALLALWPEHILFASLLGTEVPFTTAILFAIFLLSVDSDICGLRTKSLICGAGLTFGIAHWIRPTAPIFILTAFLFVLLRPRPARTRVADGFCFLAGVLLAVAPVMRLNQSVIGLPSPIPSQQGGLSLLTGTEPETHGHYSTKASRDLHEELSRRVNPGLHPQVFKDRVAREMAVKRILNRPGDLVILALRYKIPDLWAVFVDTSRGMQTSRLSRFVTPLFAVGMIYHTLMLLLCSAAVLRSPRSAVWQWSAITIYVYAALGTTAAHLLLPGCCW